MYFDGSDVGLSATDVDGFALLADGSILLTLNAEVSLSSPVAVDDSDIVRFVPVTLGANTAGAFAWYFDGSDVGLTTNGEDLDAIGFAPDGRLVVSTVGGFGVDAISGSDEDLIAFTATALGADTSGGWAWYFDGSDVGLADASSEDVNGTWIDASGEIYLSTLGVFSVAGVSGDGADIFVCAPTSVGATTACTFGPGLYWDGSVHGFAGEVVDGLEIKR